MGREKIIKVSFGYDSHRTDTGRKLVLGGVQFVDVPGLVGHSDADVLCHAVADALISAAGLGDIGKMFPDDDPELKGADSLALLRKAASIAEVHGYKAINCDCTLVAEKPRIAGHTGLMARNIAGALGIAEDMVTVKGKTNEGMDCVGRGEGMSAYAVMLVGRE